MPTRRRRSSARSKTPWGWIAAGAAAAGVGAYYLLKPSTAQALPVPPVPGPTPSTPIQLPNPTPSIRQIPIIGPNGPQASAAVISRLRSSDTARQLYALQSLFYSYDFAPDSPDGIEGPITDGLIAQINRLGSFTTEPARYTARSIGNAAAVLSQRYGAPRRVIPFTLPTDVINLVNASIARVSSLAPLLQVLPTTPPDQYALSGATGGLVGNAGRVLRPAGRVQTQAPTVNGRPVHPAGQVIPVAGYDRPLTVQPTNTVSSNPGWGVLTDPNGMNIGLWEAMEGWMHAPLGTGVVAADVHQNPVAGQPGGYWAGYR